ncbi:MAG: hypothetical protein Unbinned8596contig1000_17 [Prokaryotic dsDNA virus sp.]|nr:MAG: hypothetical protein Unbinned8596contig1000_17 [Prokaryotic dsDNA virus sp.]
MSLTKRVCDVIHSCKTLEQLVVAERYATLASRTKHCAPFDEFVKRELNYVRETINRTCRLPKR